MFFHIKLCAQLRWSTRSLINLYLSQQFKYMFFHIFICTEISYKMEKWSPQFCLQFRNRNESTEGRKTIHVLQYLSVFVHLGPVHTNPFSNKNGAVLFCSVFKKIFVHTYRFRIVFARPHYNADQKRSHMVACVRHFGYSRSSGLAPSRVYLMSHRFQIALAKSVF